MDKKLTLNELIAQRSVEAAIEAKLATGKFKDTGAKYTAEQATSDHNNPALRMTATINTDGSLGWKQ